MDEVARTGFDGVFASIASSGAYRDAVREAFPETPDWVVPFNVVELPLLARIAGALNLKGGENFVDLACGMGGPGIWIAQATGGALTGVDFSQAAIDAAAGLARDRGVDARFVCADATATGLPAAAFDALVSLDALQFMPPQAVSAEIARLLKPGGRVAVTTWEAVIDDHPRPTMVKDYEPYFAGAGLDLTGREILAGFVVRQRTFYQAIVARAGALRADAGEFAEHLIEEAQTGLAGDGAPPRVRRVLLLAKKR